MMQDRIDYEALVQKALRNVIRDVLADVAKNGLPGEHHFYLTFATQAAGVEISPRLKERFPELMTIVLQHRFWDMRLFADSFTVTLSFGGVSEKLTIPFAAMRIFYDPAAAFEVAFNTAAAAQASQTPPHGAADGVLAFPPQTRGEAAKQPAPQNSAAEKFLPHMQIPQNLVDVLNGHKSGAVADGLRQDSERAAADGAKSGDAADAAGQPPKAEQDDRQADKQQQSQEKPQNSASVVSLDAFRKK